jgi:hypothetical protein
LIEGSAVSTLVLTEDMNGQKKMSYQLPALGAWFLSWPDRTLNCKVKAVMEQIA